MSFPKAFFKQWATLVARTYPLGTMGGAQPVDNAVSPSMQVHAMAPAVLNPGRSDMGVVLGNTQWRVTFQTDPAIVPDEPIVLHEFAENVAGLAAIIHRGEWVAGAYAKGDAVTVTGSVGGIPKYYYASAATSAVPPAAPWKPSRVINATKGSAPVFQSDGELWRVNAQEITH
jgi:hypothetical protein